MNHREGIRALLEASIIAQIESGKLDEGFFGNLAVKGARGLMGAGRGIAAAGRGAANVARRVGGAIADKASQETSGEKMARQDAQLARRKKLRTMQNIASVPRNPLKSAGSLKGMGFGESIEAYRKALRVLFEAVIEEAAVRTPKKVRGALEKDERGIATQDGPAELAVDISKRHPKDSPIGKRARNLVSQYRQERAEAAEKEKAEEYQAMRRRYLGVHNPKD